MRFLTKLVLATSVALGGYEGARWWRRKNFSQTLQNGHSYAIVLSFNGQGVGGPLSTTQIQNFMDQAFGLSATEVSSTTTDAAKKLITFVLKVDLGSPVATTGALCGFFPAPFGTMTVESVTDVGNTL